MAATSAVDAAIELAPPSRAHLRRSNVESSGHDERLDAGHNPGRLPAQGRVLSTMLQLTVQPISSWWQHYIDPCLIVHDELNRIVHDPRDFLALERSHLAYIRTSNVLALFGVVTAQMFVLNNTDSVHGRWLAASAYVLAIALALVSGIRTIWLQDNIISGFTATAGAGFVLLGICTVALLVAVLVFDALS